MEENGTGGVICHINLRAIQANFRHLGNDCLPVIKTNAYGHGMIMVARALKDMAQGFAVGNAGEAIALRKENINNDLYLLTPGMYQEAENYKLTAMLAGFEDLQKARGHKIKAIIKIDTGMSRLGFAPEELFTALETLKTMPEIEPVTLMSHFSGSEDESLVEMTRGQIRLFGQCLELARRYFPKIKGSLANSAGTLNWPEARFDMPRAGFALYGLNPFPLGSKWEEKGAGLKPAMRVTTKVIARKKIKKGAKLSYNAQFTAPEDMEIAILSLGYANGFPQIELPITFKDKKTHTLGKICMNMCLTPLCEGEPEVITPSSPFSLIASLASINPYLLLVGVGNSNTHSYIV